MWSKKAGRKMRGPGGVLLSRRSRLRSSKMFMKALKFVKDTSRHDARIFVREEVLKPRESLSFLGLAFSGMAIQVLSEWCL